MACGREIGPFSCCSVVQGDCFSLVEMLPDGSIDAVITDPPYMINTTSAGSGKLNPWADLSNGAFWFSHWYKEVKRILVHVRKLLDISQLAHDADYSKGIIRLRMAD